MAQAFFTHATKVLAILLGLTLFSYFLIDSVDGDGVIWASYAVIIVATIKARYIILDFMEAREAPPKWRRMYETWYVSICLLLVIGEFTSAGWG